MARFVLARSPLTVVVCVLGATRFKKEGCLALRSDEGCEGEMPGRGVG